jgi:hypothetical protein
MWWKKKTTRKELEQDAKEDLELKDDDADKIAGGTTIKLTGTQTTSSTDKW